MHVGIAYPRLRGKHSRHSWCMHKPQFYVSGKRPIHCLSDPNRISVETGSLSSWQLINTNPPKDLNNDSVIWGCCTWHGLPRHQWLKAPLCEFNLGNWQSTVLLEHLVLKVAKATGCDSLSAHVNWKSIFYHSLYQKEYLPWKHHGVTMNTNMGTR